MYYVCMCVYVYVCCARFYDYLCVVYVKELNCVRPGVGQPHVYCLSKTITNNK